MLLLATVITLQRATVMTMIGGAALGIKCVMLLDDLRRGGLGLAIASVLLGATLPI